MNSCCLVTARRCYPASTEPQPLRLIEDDLATGVLGDVTGSSADITHVQRARLSLVVVDEDALLAVFVLEVAVVPLRCVAVDGRWLSTVIAVLIAHLEDGFRIRHSVPH